MEVIDIEPKGERVAFLLRMPEHLKDFIDNRAEELGYSTTEYLNLVLTSIMDDVNE